MRLDPLLERRDDNPEDDGNDTGDDGAEAPGQDNRTQKSPCGERAAELEQPAGFFVGSPPSRNGQPDGGQAAQHQVAAGDIAVWHGAGGLAGLHPSLEGLHLRRVQLDALAAPQPLLDRLVVFPRFLKADEVLLKTLSRLDASRREYGGQEQASVPRSTQKLHQRDRKQRIAEPVDRAVDRQPFVSCRKA